MSDGVRRKRSLLEVSRLCLVNGRFSYEVYVHVMLTRMRSKYYRHGEVFVQDIACWRNTVALMSIPPRRAVC